MKVPFFVAGSSLMISLWLVATYIRPVPMETYKGPGPSVAVDETGVALEELIEVE